MGTKYLRTGRVKKKSESEHWVTIVTMVNNKLN